MERKTFKIHELALDQLRQWEVYAKRWNYRLEMREWEGREQWHFICSGYAYSESDRMPWGSCGQSIATAHDGSHGYLLSTESVLARVVAHLRNVHRDIEIAVYGGENSGREHQELASDSDNRVSNLGNRRDANRRKNQK